MKTILGIIGSPRRHGNSELMIKAVARYVPQEHTLRLLKLQDFAIKACLGCYACLFKKKQCILKDDLYTVIEAMAEADGLIVAAPAYFLGANSLFKRFLDRGLAFSPHMERLWDKPAVGIGIAGIEGKEGYTQLIVESFLKLTGADVKGARMVYGALPGEVLLGDTGPAAAKLLGEALFGTPLKSDGPHCPLCGGQTFRFLGENRVRCMLCSNAGSLGTGTDGHPVFNITRSAHELFLTRKDAADHMEWLKEMKRRFLENRERLKQVTEGYKGDGEWIRPAKK